MSDARREVGKYCCSRYSCQRVSEILTEMGGMCKEHSNPLLFPLQLYKYDYEGLPKYVPWEFVKPFDKRAQANHSGQTLARLAERGGLSPKELLSIIENKDYYLVDSLSKEKVVELIRQRLREWIHQ